jgi:hypothetical protein
VSAMEPGLAKIIERVCISTYFECAETDLQIAENAGCIDYADTWSAKRVHQHSKTQCPDRSTAYYGCEDTLELDARVARMRLSITWIHARVAYKPKIQQLPTSIHNTGWVDDC